MQNLNISGLASHLLQLYDDWSKARKTLIEEKWEKNIEAFKCISSGKWKSGEAVGWRSDTFVPAIKSKVIAAYSMVLDILLQTGELPFALTPSDETTMLWDEQDPAAKTATTEAIEDMTHIINGQMADCKADRQLMLVVLSDAVYGEAYGKRYAHEVSKTKFMQVSLAPEGMEDDTGLYSRFVKQIDSKIQPGWEYVSPWNVIRDLESEELNAGIGLFQREYISPYNLRQKIGTPNFIDEEIKSAISEAARDDTGNPKDDASLPPGLRDIPHRKNNIRHLEYYGRVPRKLAQDFISQLGDNKPDSVSSADMNENDGDEIEVVVNLAGDRIIRYVEVEQTDRPFYRIVWEQGLDSVHGTGVADNGEHMQKVLNGSVRAFEDNTKLASDVLLAIKGDAFPKWDGVFKPGAKLDVSEEVDDVRKALHQIIVTPTGNNLLPLIELMERYLDEATLLPKVLQGDLREKKKPDTAFEMNQLQENASKYLGSVIRNVDEGLLEPVVKDFYLYNMEDPTCEKGKGDFTVNAWGFKAFTNRVQRLEKLMQLLMMVTGNPILLQEAKPRDLLDEIWNALNLDADLGLKTEAEKAEEAEIPSPEEVSMKADVAARQARAERDMADAELAKEKAESERVEQQVKGFGVEFDNERQKIDKAKAVSEIETNAVSLMQPPAQPNAKERGTNPYRERGIRSNNQSA